MPERSLFRRLLERALPWFDVERYYRDRAATTRVVSRADRVIAEVQRVENVIRGTR